MKLVLLLFTVLTFGFSSSELKHYIKEAKISIVLPNSSWFLADKVEKNGMIVYFFKREYIEDEEGMKVVPNISVIIENVDKNLDVIAYSTLKRSIVNFEVLEVFTHEGGLLNYKNAIGYKGRYSDKNNLEHTIYVVHGINGKKGFQFIFDTTNSIMDEINQEFITTLKSIQS